MALLDSATRLLVGDHVMRLHALAGLTKPDLRAAVAATDQWQEDNTVSYNTALPEPFKSVAGPVVKTLLYCYVAMRRAGILSTEKG